VKLLGRNNDDDGSEASISPEVVDAPATRSSGTTAPKGRPTPRRDAGRKGPVAPAPMTSSEARARRKSLAGPKLSREERKEQSTVRRAAMNERRERMMNGDERYLLSRDQGPVRRYVRDIVDARRNALGLFMPSALGLMFLTFAATPLEPYVPHLQAAVPPAMLVLMTAMVMDGIILGRKVSRMVDEKFPEDTESRWKLGLYATSRASQVRRMRAPRPQVKHGSTVD
jgi:hypothetical protein